MTECRFDSDWGCQKIMMKTNIDFESINGRVAYAEVCKTSETWCESSLMVQFMERWQNWQMHLSWKQETERSWGIETLSLRHIFFSIKPPLHMNVILIYYGCCEWKATNDVLWQLGVDLDFSKVLACSHCMTCLGLRCFILSQGNANCDENHSQAHFQMESMTEETLERDVVVYVRGYCWVVARVGY